jgi:hypothetical protein
MTNIDHLLDRNRAFADTDARRDVPALPFLPRQGLYIVICIDCRVDPAQVLGIELGDALVQRPRRPSNSLNPEQSAALPRATGTSRDWQRMVFFPNTAVSAVSGMAGSCMAWYRRRPRSVGYSEVRSGHPGVRGVAANLAGDTPRWEWQGRTTPGEGGPAWLGSAVSTSPAN